MNTAICFSNNQIKVVCGAVKGKRVKVRSYFTEPLPDGVINNGAILDPEHLKVKLMSLKRSRHIGNKAWIVIDSSNILFKASNMPFMKPNEIQAAVRQEFDNLDSSYEELVFDYSVLEPCCEGQKYGRVLCCAMGRKMLQSYMDVAKAAGISLGGCDIAANGIIKAVALLPKLCEETFVLSTVENRSISCLLFSKGNYLFYNRSPLLSEPGTDEYAAEVAGKLSTIKQFYKSEQGSDTLERAYLYGITEKELEQCRVMVSYLGMSLDALPESPLVQAGNKHAVPFKLGSYFSAVGGLLRK